MTTAATTMVHVRMERKLKARATKALAAMGLSVSDAVRLTLTRVAAEQALPFDVRVPNAKTVAAMKEARAGGLKSHASVASLMADLDADD
jgi:DNA-damage-inducible protein J